jgi:class 3 adenylate cyclase
MGICIPSSIRFPGRALQVSSDTFLFTDLVGFTALTEANGDEHAADLALDFYRRVRTLLPLYAAEEVKTIGDAMMIHASDPAHAIALGLCILRELESVPGFPPVRVGMATGPATCRERDWYGNTVNVAARLCSAAGGGEVLVSDATGRAAGRIPKVELGEPRLHWLKNVTQPVSARLASERPCRLAGSRFHRFKTAMLKTKLEGASP